MGVQMMTHPMTPEIEKLKALADDEIAELIALNDSNLENFAGVLKVASKELVIDIAVRYAAEFDKLRHTLSKLQSGLAALKGAGTFNDGVEAAIFDLGNGTGVCSNPKGRFHGWLFRRHPDGYWVSLRKLEPKNPNEGMPDIFGTRPTPTKEG
jgi:hypothetical protein